MTTLNNTTPHSWVTRLMSHESDVRPEIDIITKLKKKLLVITHEWALGEKTREIIEQIRIELLNLWISSQEISSIESMEINW
jgi:hypothetical protein